MHPVNNSDGSEHSAATVRETIENSTLDFHAFGRIARDGLSSNCSNTLEPPCYQAIHKSTDAISFVVAAEKQANRKLTRVGSDFRTHGRINCLSSAVYLTLRSSTGSQVKKGKRNPAFLIYDTRTRDRVS